MTNRPQTPLTTHATRTTIVADTLVALALVAVLLAAGYAYRAHQDAPVIERQRETIHALYQASALPEQTPGPLAGY